MAQNKPKSLEHAYKKNSVKLLKEFCDNWSKEIPAISELEYRQLNDTLKNIYDLFKVFFTPFNSEKLGYSNSLNAANTNYFVLPTSILVYFKDKVYYSESEKDSLSNNNIQFEMGTLIDTVLDFHPETIYTEVKLLFLSEKYDTIINNFLLKSLHSYYGILNIGGNFKDYANRVKYIDTCIHVNNKCMGRGKIIYTFPKAEKVVFDRTMKYARVIFIMQGCSVEAMYKHEINDWILVSTTKYFID